MGILYKEYGAKRLMSLNEPFKEYMALLTTGNVTVEVHVRQREKPRVDREGLKTPRGMKENAVR